MSSMVAISCKVRNSQNRSCSFWLTMGEKETVCVTGAGGFVASWVTKLLLSQGFNVHGTARDPGDEKNAHLKKLENASENLQMFRADLFDFEGLCAAIAGCSGVFHIACSVPSEENFVFQDEREFIEPALRGTRNVLDACVKAKVKRVVVVSSAGAVVYNPKWLRDKPMDEECWSDPEYCKKAKTTFAIYCHAKTLAEIEALEYAKKSELRIITVKSLVEILKRLYPDYNYPKRIIELSEDLKISSEKLQKLGWKYRPLEETIADTINNYMKKVVQCANKC